MCVWVDLPSAELDVWSCASTGSECELIQNITFAAPATFHITAPHTSIFAGALRPSMLYASSSPTLSQTPLAAGDSSTWLAAAESTKAAEQGSTSLVLIVVAAACGAIGVVMLAVCVRVVWRHMQEKPVTLPVQEPDSDQQHDDDLGRGSQSSPEHCSVPIPIPCYQCSPSPKRTPAEEFRGFEQAL
mmetsp:Transcript_41681/g.74794  ORF Transcript_41681/g.74794 Transcript_41681/m.74794 type:complete len:187 (-) Transcript_41681:1341-1901(-)